MTHEKLSPVLGMARVADAQRGIDAARAVVRIGGAGHSASIHSEDARTIMEFTARVPVLRVTVNIGNSTGSSGLGTNLAPSMTLGTGFVGRSSVGENLEARHLINWAKIAYNVDESVPMPSFAGLNPWHAPHGAVPAYPTASNLGPREAELRPGVADAVMAAVDRRVPGGGTDQFREEIRRLVVEELSQLMKG